MPPRSRRSDPPAVFELVPDDERHHRHAEDDDLREDGERVAAGARLAERWRRLSRRGRVAVAATTAVVVAGTATAIVLPGQLDARDQRLRAEAVRGLPGVVEDLSEPLDPTWKVAGDKIDAALAGGGLLASDDAFARAFDASTGTELWAHEVGADPVCGPGPAATLDLGRPVDVVVCLGGDPRDRTATVLEASGAVVGTRKLGATGDPAGDRAGDPTDDPTRFSAGEPSPSTPRVSPGPSGTLAVVEGTGSDFVPVSADLSSGEALRALQEAGWATPTLRIEDALTGEVLDRTTIHLGAQDLEECAYVEDEDGELEVQPQVSISTSGSLVFLRVCGAIAGASTDGAARDLPELTGWPQPLPGGGTVVVGEESTYLDDEGAQVATVRGWAMPPVVDDEPDGPLLSLVADESTGIGGARLTATTRDGEPLWTSAVGALASAPALARLAGTVVVADDDRVVGLDASSGTELWAADGLLESASDGPGEQVVGAVTDGTRLLLGISADAEARLRLVALDVRDGSIAWERTHVVSAGVMGSVDGRPLLVSPTWRSAHGLG